jgi:hypothetical protein
MASQEACIKIRTKSEIERSKHAAKNRKKQYKRQVKAHKDEEDKDAILEHMRMNDDGAGAPEPLPRREHQSHYRGAKHIDETEGRLLGAHPFLPCPEPGNAGQITNLGAARFLSTRGSWDFPPPPVCPGGPGDEDPESDNGPNSQRKCLSSPNSQRKCLSSPNSQQKCLSSPNSQRKCLSSSNSQGCVTETTSDPTPSDHDVKKNSSTTTSTTSPSTIYSTDTASMPLSNLPARDAGRDDANTTTETAQTTETAKTTTDTTQTTTTGETPRTTETAQTAQTTETAKTTTKTTQTTTTRVSRGLAEG